jgi:hypothetical protein
MIKIEAAKRLKLHATHTRFEEAEVEETAAFDESRSEELLSFIKPLAKVGLRFSFKDHCLKCTVEVEEAVDCAKRCALVLNKLGCRLSIRPRVFDRPTFALRGANGIILQRISPTMLRIFFTK